MIDPASDAATGISVRDEEDSAPHDERIALAKWATRRLHTAFKLSTRDRAHFERALLRRLLPLA